MPFVAAALSAALVASLPMSVDMFIESVSVGGIR